MTHDNHVTCVVCDDHIRMGGNIVYKLCDFFIVFLVGLACWIAMDPRAVSIVASTDLA